MTPTPLQHLTELLQDPSLTVSVEWVDEMARLYPYMTLPAKLLLERSGDTLDEDTRRRIMQRMALNNPSPEALYRIANPKSDDADFYPPAEQPQDLDTDTAIETFMSHYGRPDPQESALLERLIFNPVPDYALTLADEEERSLPSDEEATGDDADSLINAFILKSRREGGHFPSSTDNSDTPEADTHSAPDTGDDVASEPLHTPATTAEQGLLSESLAKFFIKQRRYAKAYEIISNLSLKFPEKSRYFADQLRFLQKLIINEQFQKQK